MHYPHHESYKGLTIKIAYDEDGANPFKEWDGEPDIIGWHRHYDFNTRAEDKAKTPRDFLNEAKAERHIYLPLYMYDHGGIAFSTVRAGQFADPWDSGQYGFIFWTREKIEAGQGRGYGRRITAKKRAFLTQQLRTSVELLNDYVQGNVYGYIVGDGGEQLDSCWGFYGDIESCLAEARSAADHYAAQKYEAAARALEASRPDMYAHA